MKRIFTIILAMTIAVCCIPSIIFASVNYEGDCEINSNVYKIPNEPGTYTYYFIPEDTGIYAIYQNGVQYGSMTYKMYEERNGVFVQLDAAAQPTGGGSIKVYKTANCDFYIYKAATRYKLEVTNTGNNQLSDFQIKRLKAYYDVDIVASEGGYIARELSLETDGDSPNGWPLNFKPGLTDFRKTINLSVVDYFTPSSGEGIVVKPMEGYEFAGFYLENTDFELTTSKWDSYQPYLPSILYYLRTSPDEIGPVDGFYIEARFKKIGQDEEKNDQLKPQQIMGTDRYSKSVGEASFTLDVSTSGDGTLSYSSSNPAVAAVSSTGRVSIISPGTTVITVIAAKTSQYQEASKQITITVTDKKDQILTGTTLYHKKIGDSDFQLNIKSSGDGKLSYSTDNLAVAGVSPTGLVSINGEGTARITVNVSQTGDYNAGQIIVTVNVQKKETEISRVTNFKTILNKNNKDLTYAWDEIEDCDGYKLSYSYDGKIWNTLMKSLISEGTVDISPLKKGNLIYLKAQAYKIIDGKTVIGKDSAIITVRRVSTPVLRLNKINRFKIRLSWKATKSADGYEIYRKVKGGTYKKIFTTKKAVFVNQNLKKRKTYYYYLKPYQINEADRKVYGTRTSIKKVRL